MSANIFCWMWIYDFLIFALFTNGQPQSTLNGHANKYKLWFISSLHTLRAETSCKPRKAETSCIPTKNVYVSPRHLRHYHWNLLFHQKPQIGVVVCADVSENILPETKNNFSGIDILTCPSLSSHVLLLQVIYMLSCNTSLKLACQRLKRTMWKQSRSQHIWFSSFNRGLSSNFQGNHSHVLFFSS